MSARLDEGRWQAVVSRDATKDGQFVFGVATTGVYCRPSCGARRPLRKNVRFFDAPLDAERAGLRACKRCRPAEDAGAQLRVVCDALRVASAEPEPAVVRRIAAQLGTSPRALTRTFTRALGLSPKQYVEACRLEALKAQLRASDSIALAVFEAGYSSGSRVYERADRRLGMTPGRYALGGATEVIAYASAETRLGTLLVGATNRGVCFAQFGKGEAALLEVLKQEFPRADVTPMAEGARPDFDAWMEALREHLDDKRPHLDVPLDVRGTAFQFQVWRFLQTIPAGTTQTYSQVARALKQPTATRAVARACAANRVALLVPCHRVLRADGALGGYRWGVERKRALLRKEREGAGPKTSARSGSTRD